MIKKPILVALVAGALVFPLHYSFAENSSSTARERKPEVNLTCMQTASSKRDSAVIAGFDSYYSGIKTALQTRQSSLSNAWTYADRKARRSAIKSAWDAFRTSAKTTKKAFKESKGAAWSQFRTDAKACGPSAGDDGANPSVDAEL